MKPYPRTPRIWDISPPARDNSRKNTLYAGGRVIRPRRIFYYTFPKTIGSLPSPALSCSQTGWFTKGSRFAKAAKKQVRTSADRQALSRSFPLPSTILGGRERIVRTRPGTGCEQEEEAGTRQPVRYRNSTLASSLFSIHSTATVITYTLIKFIMWFCI